jgi:putative methionine-R-sulfoxide reductase with GAF domain
MFPSDSVGCVTAEVEGGRVLVVAPSDPENAAGTDGDGGATADGDDPNGGGERPGDDTPTADSGAHRGRVCGPGEIVAELADRLPVDVVLRDEETAAEYLAELGPTLDCVVVLGASTDPLDGPVDDGSVPSIVCEGPVVETPADVPADAVTVGEVTAEVRGAVREGRGRSHLHDRTLRLTALNRYARDITGCETVDAVLERTVEATADALAVDRCVVYVVDGDRLVPRASAPPELELRPVGVDEGVVGRALAAGAAEIVDDVRSEPDPAVRDGDLRTVLSVPIGSSGVLQIASADRGAFDDRDREFVEILSGYTRESLARLEREVGLRTERDRLHAFYAELPLPALRVERRDDGIAVTDANTAYESAFGTTQAGQPLADGVATETERGRYEAALGGEGIAQGPVLRPALDGSSREYTLTVIPASSPAVSDAAFGVYQIVGAGSGEERSSDRG